MERINTELTNMAVEAVNFVLNLPRDTAVYKDYTDYLDVVIKYLLAAKNNHETIVEAMEEMND